MIPKILSKLCDRDLANSLPRSGGFNEASEQLDSHQVWMIGNIEFPNNKKVKIEIEIFSQLVLIFLHVL